MIDDRQSLEIDELRERVARLEAERDVRDLLAAYAYAADGCRDDEWLDLFTDDAVIDITYREDGVLHRGRWEGREALTAYISGDAHHHQYYGSTMHLHSLNLSIEIEADVATIRAYSLNLRAPKDGSDVRVTSPAMNRWTAVRQDRGWRIKERLRRVLGDAEAWNLVLNPDVRTDAHTLS